MAPGNAVYSGPININGLAYTGSQALTGGDFAATRESLTHLMQGLAVKSHTQGAFDWEVDASLYDYRKDDKRQNAASNPFPDAASGGAGTLADGSGTGWNNLALKGIWRPGGLQGEHIVDFGVQLDSYKLAYLTSNIPGNWLDDGPGSLASDVSGKTRLFSVYGQDAWAFAPRWKTVLGLRAGAVAGLRRPDDVLADAAGPVVSVTARELPVAEGGAVVPGARRRRAQGVGWPRGADADGERALRRDLDDQLAVHQRSEPEARALVDGGADRGKGSRQRRRAPDLLRGERPRLALLADDVRSGREQEHQPGAERRPDRDPGRRGRLQRLRRDDSRAST